MVHKHDWVIGLLCEVERYCKSNDLNRLAAEVSQAISTAADEIDVMQPPSNVINLSEYREKAVLKDAESIVGAYGRSFEDVLN